MTLWLSLWLAGCAHSTDEDQACFEAQTAMGARLEECTGDAERGIALMDALEADYRCQQGSSDPRLDEANSEDIRLGIYECAFVLRNLACELAETYDQQPATWLESHPVCELLWVPQ